VEDLLASSLTVHRVVTASSLEDTERGRALVSALGDRGIETVRLSDRDFERLAATESPQGVLAVADIPRWAMESVAPAEGRSVVLVLDAVQDPGNFGTLVRSAEALGASGVVALPGTVDPWNPKAVRASAGSTFRVPVIQATWAESAAALREMGFRLLGADTSGDPVAQMRG